MLELWFHLLVSGSSRGGRQTLTTKKAFILAKSSSGNIKVFAEEEQLREKTGESPSNPTYKIVALYGADQVNGELILCSPTQEKSNYYLLKRPRADEWWTQKVDGSGGVNCDRARDYQNFGEKLELNIVSSPAEQGSLPKEISLKDCKFRDLRSENNEQRLPSLEFTCYERQKKGEVKIFDLGLEELSYKLNPASKK